MVEINNTTKTKIKIKEIALITEKFLKYHKIGKKEVSIAFVADKKMKELNRTYRGFDKVTDVLSFEGEDDFLGEIIICPGQIKRQAPENGKSFADELIFILIHGLLHLVGGRDDTEKQRISMIEKGNSLIKKLKTKK